MCGILGIYRFDGATVDPAVVQAMMGLQAHRGPDDRGLRLFGLRGAPRSAELRQDATAAGPFEGALGFNRLSILDLSLEGHQPMTAEDGQVFVVFNGEIYNSPDHRRALEADGRSFHSRTDTEVILALYLRHGFHAMLDRLNGMFALCIVDLRARRMHLARDRFGIKPLYWTNDGKRFAFASEIKSFLALPDFTPEISADDVAEYAQFRYTAADRTLFRGVRQLEPGCWMEVGPDGTTSGSYWELPPRRTAWTGDIDAAVDELDGRLHASVRAQLLSDVRLGCQLSGGVDSSLISILATAEAGTDLDGVAVTCDEPGFSEAPWVAAAAARARIDTHDVTLTADRFLDSLDDAVWHMDQPINHPNAVGLYWLARTAREHVTVLLSGEGADETFGGYHRYAFVPLAAKLGPALPLLTRLPVVGAKFRERFGDPGRMSPEERAVAATATIGRSGLAALLPDADWRKSIALRRERFVRDGDTFIDDFLNYDMRTFLPDLLIRQDKMTMAHSVENRVPFLDHELLAFVAGLPTGFLVRPGWGTGARTSRYLKRVLKILCARYFGEEHAWRSKMGFALPLRRYFEHPLGRAKIGDVVLPGVKKRGLFDPEYVERLWANLDVATAGDLETLWTVMSFETWAHLFVDGAREPPKGTGR